MPITPSHIDTSAVGDFRFRNLEDSVLLTNEVGEFCFVKDSQFKKFLYGATERIPSLKLGELKNKGFLRSNLNVPALIQKYITANKSVALGPSLHIVVLTRRCDHKCVYCQASARSLKNKGADMSLRVAERVVHTIFESASPDIRIEFQGGEPLLNFKAIKYIVESARRLNQGKNKGLLISLVTNLTYMDSEKLDFLLKNDVSICTSLDGPERIHNNSRVTPAKNSYKNTVKWIKEINKLIRKRSYPFKVEALTTITRSSLQHPREIIDEFVGLGFGSIDLRPVQPFGMNFNKWKLSNFPAEEFMKFYEKAFEYILKLNSRGKIFFERRALIFLTKILTGRDPNFLDLRSPCGAGIGQLAYDVNGDVYTCDEGRMFAALSKPDHSFRLGNVLRNSYGEIMQNDALQTLCFASCLNNLPLCNNCVYKPYCGICPLYNYAMTGDLFMKGQNFRCKINQLTLDLLFRKLSNPQDKGIFLNWLKHLKLISQERSN